MVGTHFDCDHNCGKLCQNRINVGYIEEKNRIYSINENLNDSFDDTHITYFSQPDVNHKETNNFQSTILFLSKQK